MVVLILIFALVGASLYITNDDINSRLAFNEEKSTFLDSINNNSTVVVYNTDYGYKILHNDLNNTKQYTLSGQYFYDDDIEISKDLDVILEKNPNKNVYLVTWKTDTEYEKSYDLEKQYDAGHYSFNLVKR